MSLVRKVVDAILGHSATLAAHERKLEDLTKQLALVPQLDSLVGFGSVSTALLNRTTLVFVKMTDGGVSGIFGQRLKFDRYGYLSVDDEDTSPLRIFAGHHVIFEGCIGIVALGLSLGTRGLDTVPIYYVLTSEGTGLPAVISGDPSGEKNEFYPWQQSAGWPRNPDVGSDKSSDTHGLAYAQSMVTADPQVTQRMKFNVGDAVMLHWDVDSARFYFNGYNEPLHEVCTY
ncbi:MAG: hypothetical protein ABII12_03110 [Planctomycetota bacterium]